MRTVVVRSTSSLQDFPDVLERLVGFRADASFSESTRFGDNAEAPAQVQCVAGTHGLTK